LQDPHSIVAVRGDIVIHLSAQHPVTFDEYGVFVDAFFAQQPSERA
jgi:hypothetical protein